MRMASMQQWMMRPIDSRVHATDPKLLSPESASSCTHAEARRLSPLLAGQRSGEAA